MAGRRIVKPRFFVILAVFLLGIVLLVRALISPKDAVVTLSDMDGIASEQALIVRNEKVESYDVVSRIDYVALEEQTVTKGQTIMHVYAEGLGEDKLLELLAVQQEIATYQQESTEKDVLNPELDALNANIDTCVHMLSLIMQGKEKQDALTIEAALTVALDERQKYLKKQEQVDSRLSELYEREKTAATYVLSWRSEIKAADDGIVSFYLDGYEGVMVDQLTIKMMKDYFAGGKPEDADVSNRGRQKMYRLVTPGPWYVLLVSTSWQLTQGQSCQFTFEGYEDQIYDATVANVTTGSGKEKLVRLEITQDIGPLLHLRKGKITLTSSTSGLKVPQAALITQDEQPGVMVRMGSGSSQFVAVSILSYTNDGKNAVVRPLTENGLRQGDRVLLP